MTAESAVSSAVPLPSDPGRPGKLPSPPGLTAKIGAFFRRHPVLFLLLLTPGIPEYLSSSTRISYVVLNPAAFLIFFALNAALYAPGALLIREAMVRWHKGWATVLILGVAYGIVEEGIALSTLFNPLSGVVGSLGFFGHYAGVNWVWSAGLLMFHSVYSIGLPILLLQLAVPETKGKSLLSRRGLGVTAGIWTLDILLLVVITVVATHFWLGVPLLLESVAVVVALAAIAYWVPADGLRARSERPKGWVGWPALGGAALFPGVLLLESIPAALGWGALAVIGLLLLWYGAVAWFILGRIGRQQNEARLVSLAAGLLFSVAAFGFLASFSFPLVALIDLIAGWFLWKLWTLYREPGPALTPAGTAIPPGATW